MIPQISSRTEIHLGTTVGILACHADTIQAEGAMDAAFAEIVRLQGIFDHHRPDTPLAVLNREGGLADAPPELCQVLAEALRIGEISGHAFDVTVLPLIRYLHARKNPTGELCPDPAAFAEARALVRPDGVHLNGRNIHLENPGMAVTLDAIAKGYIADRASEVLAASGVGNHLINAGGDIRVQGAKGAEPWRIGIREPGATAPDAAPIAVLPLCDQAVATSGGYEIFYDRTRRHHHLIDPATGQSPAVRSVSVVAPTAMEADALATALAILLPDDALELVRTLPGRACLIVQADGSISASPGWPAYS